MDPEVEALYGLGFEEFIPARNALARARTRAGDREGAAAVKALHKPPTVAWALNQLARRQQEAVAQLLEAGQRLRRAQTAALEGGDPTELRDAARDEAADVNALAGLARSILAEAGRPASTTVEERLADTLRAAAVDPDSGELLRRGVLATELSPAGFGFGTATDIVERAAPSPGPGRPVAEKRAQAEARREAQERDKALRRAEAEAERLGQAAHAAEARAEDARKAAQAAIDRVAALQEEALKNEQGRKG